MEALAQLPHVVQQWKALRQKKKSSALAENLATAEKEGFFTGRVAINPFSGAEPCPIWVANFVLAEYGTGRSWPFQRTIERDYEFRHQSTICRFSRSQPLKRRVLYLITRQFHRRLH